MIRIGNPHYLASTSGRCRRAEYETPTSNYADLTSIAKQVKDTDGTLNLAKLGTFLATKPKELEKYCDY
jgi:hypothetical protein